MSVHVFETFHRRKDGSDYDVEVHLERIQDGSAPRLCAFILDTTERNQLEKRLRQAQRMEAVGQLTGGVAHDFNNILSVLIGNAELLADLLPEQDGAYDHLDAILMASERAAALTNRLLAFSRQLPLSPEATNVSDLVNGLADMLQRTLGETISLKLRISDDTWPAVMDAREFENALVNLCINARDAMPGGGTLLIETGNTVLDQAYVGKHDEVSPGQYVTVSVSDTGTGMPPDVAAKAFEPFFTTKEVGKGSGLGLSMVYGFVKQSNGHITIYSEEGVGTTVRIYMPRASGEDTDADSPAPNEKMPSGQGRILVVEDDPGVRDVSVRTLRNQGYDVIEAASGAEAIERLNEDGPFDLLFTDMVLPGGMNGSDIARAAREIQPGIPVLYTTGYTHDAVRHIDGLHPDDELINKPFRRAELLERIRAILDRKR